MDNAEGREQLVSSERTPFSDFLIDCTRSYLDEINVPKELQEKIEKQKLFILPFGSANRGNASEEESDIDLLFIALDSTEYDLPGMVNSDFHPTGYPLDQYILKKLFDINPVVASQREEIEMSNPIFSLKQIEEAIRAGELDRTGQGGYPIDMVIALLLNTDPSLVILPKGVDISSFENAKTKVRQVLDDPSLPDETSNELYGQITQAFKEFKSHIKKRGAKDH